MRSCEAVNASLATLLFAFNNRYSFFTNPSVMEVYRQSQLFDVNPKTSKDFEILTQNSLLTALQSHAITLNESVKNYCVKIGRNKFRNDPLFDFVREFVSVFRNAKSHMGRRFFKFTWEDTFRFECWIPMKKVDHGRYRFKHDALERRRIRFSGTKDREIRVTPGFIYRLIMFSFHLIKILSFRKTSACDKYLKKFPGLFKKT